MIVIKWVLFVALLLTATAMLVDMLLTMRDMWRGEGDEEDFGGDGDCDSDLDGDAG